MLDEVKILRILALNDDASGSLTKTIAAGLK
jgi:hypothetical protein